MDSTTALTRLAQTVRETRKQRGLTQAALAQIAGVPRFRIIQAEKGQKGMAIDAFVRIVAALGAELTLSPARRPTLEEARKLFAE